VTAGEPSGHPDVVLCPGGPMLLRGEHVVEDDTGARHTTTRPVTAVCRCGRSARLPWCDGTHKVLPPAQRP
jgi:CDGSH-type Zn-finger protein